MKHRIFRAHCTNPAPKLAENEEAEYTVFVEADTPEQASMRIQVSLSTLSGLSIEEVDFYNLHSWNELVSFGVSEDTDFRAFEVGWKGEMVTVWVQHPLFLCPQNSRFLLAKWAELQMDLASKATRLAG